MNVPKEVWDLQKAYWRLKNNLAGCMRFSLINEAERKVMQTEVNKAERAYREAEEKHRYD
jgi:hypothetical protein